MSNLIKSSNYVPLDDSRMLEPIRPVYADPSAESRAVSEAEASAEREEARRIGKQIIAEAEAAAQQLTRAASEECERLKADAREEIGQWWEERRSRDEEMAADARRQGKEEGYREGKAAAEAEVAERSRETVEEARRVLEQAYADARRIVAEAEPFLIELASAIAEKIIGREMELSPEWIGEMVKRSLKRYTDKGSIALCVAPGKFAYLRSVKEELSYAIDAQADLHIYPDPSVGEHGCVIKTPLGTIDARVDTQLTEIKQALLDVAKRSVEDDDR